ncbi:MAG: HEPN domain-containing protein [Oscillospiraceae bacterium]|nr:HEPN domain-containing protein [Oscillospiraceae bacterium]
MEYYKLAEDKQKVAQLTKDAGFYADSIYASCLAVKFYLKSVMNRVPEAQEFEFTHDVINLYYAIKNKYPSSQDLSEAVKFCRKYNNESRYPYSGTTVFTDDFAEKFLIYVENVKYYIDEECQANLEDLKNKFNKH